MRTSILEAEFPVPAWGVKEFLSTSHFYIPDGGLRASVRRSNRMGFFLIGITESVGQDPAVISYIEEMIRKGFVNIGRNFTLWTGEKNGKGKATPKS
jgi:hypothetical protein